MGPVSDAELRTLERAAGAGEEGAREALLSARRRAGLGWHGESVPALLRPKDGDAGVYEHVAFVRESQRQLGLEFVYVPPSGDAGPLYVGRYPVTLQHYMLWDLGITACLPRDRVSMIGRAEPVPATGIGFASASNWCAWAGVRLPSEEEWLRAARPTEPDACMRMHDLTDGAFSIIDTEGNAWPCPKCHGTGWAWPEHPWGDEYPDSDRCAWPGPHIHGAPPLPVARPATCGACRWLDDEGRLARARAEYWRLGKGDTSPPGHSYSIPDDACRACGNAPVPCRPNGASPWGVHDMVGNVLEWTTTVIDVAPIPGMPGLVNAPTGPVSSRRHVLKGGAWDTQQGGRSLLARGWFGDGRRLPPDGAEDRGDPHVGFRAVLDGGE